MQSPSISFRHVLALLALCVATVTECIPERLQAEESQAACATQRFLQRHGQQAEPFGQFAKHYELAPYEFPLHLNETTRATTLPDAALQPPKLAAALRALVAGEAASADTAINPILRPTCAALLEGGTVFIALPLGACATIDGRILPNETPEQALATLQRLVADDQRMPLLSVAAPVQQ